MKKSIVLLFASIMMFTTACEQEQPTKFAAVYDKHTIQEDTNWVEVTEIDTIETCLGLGVFHGGLFIRDTAPIENLIQETKDFFNSQHYGLYNIDSCVIANHILEYDFVSNDIILYFLEMSGSLKCKRKIYKNDFHKSYLYLLEVQWPNDSTEILSSKYFFDEISIPKLPKGYKLEFDTINTFFD